MTTEDTILQRRNPVNAPSTNGTFVEKVFSEKAGREVRSGEVVWVKPDMMISHDGTALDAIAVLNELKVKTLPSSTVDRIKVFIDHSFPPASPLYAENYDKIRSFCEKYRVELHDKGDGISHAVMVENGYAEGGNFIAGADSHTTGIGAIPGAFGTGFGGTDLGAMWLTGETWFPVPASILVKVEGRYPPGTDALDGGFHMLKHLQPVVDDVRRSLEARHRTFTLAIELTGKGIRDHSPFERMPFTTLVKEANADTCTVIPEDVKLNEDGYEAVVELNLSEVVPYVVLPPQMKSAGFPFQYEVVPVESVEGEGHRINRVSIQSCTGAYDYTIRESAELLRRRDIDPKVQFYVVPATRRVKERMYEAGYLKELVGKRAIEATPSCGNCIGRGCGILGPDDIAISTSSRNEVGRMGHEKSIIYLASGLTATASAVNGYLTDPRRFL